ncbi:MAG: PEP-CTERM sorting domain-containing protein [Rubrivivax sp.]
MNTKLASSILALGALLYAPAAMATPYVFTASGAFEATWTLDSNPTPSVVFDDAFRIDDVDMLLNGSPVSTFIEFYSADGGGGACADVACGLFDLFGPTLFSGSLDAPEFLPGTFSMTQGGPTGAAVTLVIAAVPEPATLLMVLGALGAAGAMRRRAGHSNRPSRSHLVATHFSPASTGAPPCSVRVDGCGRS